MNFFFLGSCCLSVFFFPKMQYISISCADQSFICRLRGDYFLRRRLINSRNTKGPVSQAEVDESGHIKVWQQ